MTRLTVTCDGSCLVNPGGPGGWSWVYSEDIWAAGGHANTTNNLMELRAVHEALTLIPPEIPIRIQTDSRYTINSLTTWLPGWKRKGWRNAAGKPVANRGAIEAVAAKLVGRDVEWVHVKGHAGHLENEWADFHARNAAKATRSGSRVNTGYPERLRSLLESLKDTRRTA